MSKVYTKVCEFCDKNFNVPSAQKLRKTCSNECRTSLTGSKHKSPDNVKRRFCIICGYIFTVQFPSSKVRTCGKNCKSKFVSRNAIEYYATEENRIKTSIATKAAMERSEVRSNFEEGMKNRRSYEGENHPLWGVPCSEERKKKISQANAGKKKGMTWEEIIGETRANERRIENSLAMSKTNELLLNGRTSKLEKSVFSLIERYGFQQNVKISKYVVDFLNPANKQIIEIHGDYWHCNPVLYDSDYFNSSIEMTAQEKWDYDAFRKSKLESLGYTVYVVWEDEIKKQGIQMIIGIVKEVQ